MTTTTDEQPEASDHRAMAMEHLADADVFVAAAEHARNEPDEYRHWLTRADLALRAAAVHAQLDATTVVDAVATTAFQATPAAAATTEGAA